jgi:acyl-coenzyme A synthetase/AMP-(fatty) acid ligase/acyl carrier protein
MLKNVNLINEVDTETVIAYDKTEKHDKIIKKEFKKNNELSSEMLSINSDVFFLSTIMFTLTKFTYSKEILITKLIKNNDNEFIKTIIAKNINTNNTVKDYLNEINQLISKNTELESYFAEIIKINNLTFPDFQYYYQKEDENDLNIPESNFTIIIKKTADNHIETKIIYNSNCYNKKTIQLFHDSFLKILEEFKNKDKILKCIGIGLLSDEILEKERNDFVKPDSFLLNELFEKVVASNKDKIALIDKDKSLTFDELNRDVNRVANALIKNGLKIEDSVILKIKKSVNLIVFMFGVIKAGGTFVIVDSNDHAERISLIKEDTDAKYIIDNDNFTDFLKYEDESNPNVDLSPDNTFHITYTSGSTGKPKGVMVTHKSASSKLNVEEYDIITNDDIFLSITQAIFNLFVKDIITFLLRGLTIVIVTDTELQNPSKIADLYEKSKFNITSTTPSAMESMMEYDSFLNILQEMKMLIFGGERLTKQFLNKLKRVTNAKVFNLYGMAENWGYSNVYLILDDEFSIGKPVLNVVEQIVDIDGNPLPKGIIGELWVGRCGITKGYLNNEKLTMKKFIEIDNVPFFKTGDLAKSIENENYMILDRIDNQIKINGQSLDPGDIENNIPNDLGIEKVIVLSKNNRNNNNQILCLYFTTKSKSLNENKIDELKEKIRNHLYNILPTYMVPNIYVHLDEFPLAATGKVDKNKLMKINIEEHRLNKKFIEPENSKEKRIRKIWADILSIDEKDISTNDDFFELGGNSISSIKLSTKLEKEFNKTISPVKVFKYRTISHQSVELLEREYLHVFQKGNDNKIPIIFIHPAGGGSESYNEFASLLPESIPFYSIDNYNLLNKENRIIGIENIASTYIDILRKNGLLEKEFILGGWSFGGLIAYEMTNQLEKINNPPFKLLLFDTFLSSNEVNKVLMKEHLIKNFFQKHPMFKEFNYTEKHADLLIDDFDMNNNYIDLYMPKSINVETIYYKSLKESSINNFIKISKYEDNVFNGFENYINKIELVKSDTEHDLLFVNKSSMKEIIKSIEKLIYNILF